MAMSSNQDLSFQQWSAIQHNLSLSTDDVNFEPDHLSWLQGAEELLANLPDDNQEFESCTHLDPSPNDASALELVRRDNLGASPSISTMELLSGKVEPAKRSRGRPKAKDRRSLTSPDVSWPDPLFTLPTPQIRHKETPGKSPGKTVLT